MERKKLLYWGVQFIGWATYFLFSILLLYNMEDLRLTFSLFIFAILSIFASISVSHGIRYVIIKKDVTSRKLGQLIFITILLSVIGAIILESAQYEFEELIETDYIINPHEDLKYGKEALANAVENRQNLVEKGNDYAPVNHEVIEQGVEKAFDWPNFLFAISRSIILFLMWCGFYYAFVISEKSRKQEILHLKWEASKNEIELKNLRAQLNPHFLFNSLNSIRALVGLNPSQAKTSVTQLSTLLRRSINLGKMKVIPLKEELELVKIYLELEQIRFEERLQTEFQIAPESLSCEIPPLMIQTIVENGIKHGISKSIEGGVIKVCSEIKDSGLEIKISNSGMLELNSETSGIGISNSKKRLNLLFGANANFSIYQEEDEVIVKINIKYKEEL